MAGEAWLINPKRKRKRTKAKRRRRNPQGRYVRAGTPVRKRVRRAPRTIMATNPRRKRRTTRRRKSSYRRNPPAIRSIFNQLMPVTAGFIGTKFVGNMISPMLAQFMPGNGGPIMRIAMKVGIAYLTAWGAEQFVGKRFFMPVMLGGSIEAIQDFTREFVSPMFPALAAYEYPLSVYYEPPAQIVGPNGEVEAEVNGVGTYYDNNAFRSMT